MCSKIIPMLYKTLKSYKSEQCAKRACLKIKIYKHRGV